MKKINNLVSTRVMTALVLSAGISVPALAEVSANVGFASEYYYRGVLQKSSSASAGLDFEQSGFYAGTWAADVGDGLEVDLYLGYGLELENGLSVGVGFTGYYYTGEFDDTYEEANFSLGWGPVSVGYSVGEYGNFSGPDLDYDFLEVSVEHNGFYGTYGTFGDDFDGDYVEFGYGTEIGGFDAAVALILSSDELSDQLDSNGAPTESEALVFTLGKAFDL
ncbi:MAG: hypothetical protein JKY66_09270 [Spongiibacteraceae bacterium]|nr:hypothetical protein [Spongiibacteraceae bacterium]